MNGVACLVAVKVLLYFLFFLMKNSTVLSRHLAVSTRRMLPGLHATSTSSKYEESEGKQLKSEGIVEVKLLCRCNSQWLQFSVAQEARRLDKTEGVYALGKKPAYRVDHSFGFATLSEKHDPVDAVSRRVSQPTIYVGRCGTLTPKVGIGCQIPSFSPGNLLTLLFSQSSRSCDSF